MLPLTHHLGQLPGRARLGAYGRGSRAGTTCTRVWRGVAGGMSAEATVAVPAFDAISIETVAPTGTAHATGLNSMKRTARPSERGRRRH